jgi:hypothetical protein
LVPDPVEGKNGGSIITAFNSAVRAMERIRARHFSSETSDVGAVGSRPQF